jgi:hypothetical protein
MVLALNASGTPEQAGAVNQWFSHITNDRNQFFDTTVAAFSAPFWALSQSMAGLPGMPSAEDVAAVAAVGGGWRFASLTVEQDAAQKATAEFREPLEARVTNASALMLERAAADDTPEQLAAKWATAWMEAV